MPLLTKFYAMLQKILEAIQGEKLGINATGCRVRGAEDPTGSSCATKPP